MATTVSDMLDAINTCVRSDDEFELTEWEEKFVINIEDMVKTGKTLSQLQIARIESIYDRT